MVQLVSRRLFHSPTPNVEVVLLLGILFALATIFGVAASAQHARNQREEEDSRTEEETTSLAVPMGAHLGTPAWERYLQRQYPSLCTSPTVFTPLPSNDALVKMRRIDADNEQRIAELTTVSSAFREACSAGHRPTRVRLQEERSFFGSHTGYVLRVSYEDD